MSRVVTKIPSPSDNDEIAARLAEAALSIAEAGDWETTDFRSVTDAAGVDAATAYAIAPGKSALVDLVSRRFDLAPFAGAPDADSPPGDRLFEAVMARLEVMEPHRMALSALLTWEGSASPAMARRLARSARALMDAAGIDTSGRRGFLRRAAFTPVLIRTLAVWRDDEGALNRTMAELDRRLKQMRSALAVAAADF